MTKVFFDQLTDLSKIEKRINKVAKIHEEKLELWQLVDEILHHKVLGCVLEKLPKEYHEEFLEEFSKKPYDEGLFDYLKKRIGEDIKDFIRGEVALLVMELLDDSPSGNRRRLEHRKKLGHGK